MSDAILGTTLSGRYRLDARIGRGGMSTVYRAFDTVLERDVAIKLMHREIASESDHLERFRREARAVAQLNHAHIVTVIDAGELEAEGAGAGDDGGGGDGGRSGGDDAATGRAGTPYIVLEHVAGETLKDLIRRDAPLPSPTALAYAVELARALGAAHAQGIVHRDVKPQNVLLSGEAGAKITDFGIARTLAEEGLTMDGRVLGTTDYVSPEQALGQAVTGQSDVYSLGVVLYEMLTGSVPFTADSPVAVAMMHVREEVPDVQLARPEVAAATAVVVERATARETADRYPDMAAMLADLEAALAIETARTGQATGEATAVLRTLAPPARRLLPWRVRHPARLLVSLALLAAIVAVALVLALGATHRGTGVAPGVHAARGTVPVVLAAKAASSYNPFGTGPEHAEDVANVVDGDVNTTWSTEHYVESSLGKPGLGVSLDAAPGVAARAIELQTPTPGFQAAIYAASNPQPASAASASGGGAGSSSAGSLAALGWTQLAPARAIGARTTIAINASGTVYRYYLIWITKLPPGGQTAAISEATLFR
ncbi:MAG TPA: protein kinase [Solirubrobacteraceae bacterium]|nr:protein kinase [Solirubrobacteraceae bacterium]